MKAIKNRLGNSDKVKKVEETLSKINSSKTRFLISKASIVFTHSRKRFTKATIIHYYDRDRHIRIETDTSDFPIGQIFSQLTSRYMTYTKPDLSNFEIGQ